MWPGHMAQAAYFRFRLNDRKRAARLLERIVSLRCAVLSLPYGDQGLFIESGLFRELGGFPPLPIMEDFELVRRLRSQGRIMIPPAAIRTSPRRWLSLGVGRTTVINQSIVIAYLAGVPPHRLARWYRRSKGIE